MNKVDLRYVRTRKKCTSIKAVFSLSHDIVCLIPLMLFVALKGGSSLSGFAGLDAYDPPTGDLVSLLQWPLLPNLMMQSSKISIKAYHHTYLYRYICINICISFNAVIKLTKALKSQTFQKNMFIYSMSKNTSL